MPQGQAKIAAATKAELDAPLVDFFSTTRFVYIRWSAWSNPRIRGELYLTPPGKKSAGLYDLGDVSFRPKDGAYLYNARVRVPGQSKAKAAKSVLSQSWDGYLERACAARFLRGWECAHLGVMDGRKDNPSSEGEFQALAPVLFSKFELKRFGQAHTIKPMKSPPKAEPCKVDLSNEKAGLSYRVRLEGMVKKLELVCSVGTFEPGPPITEKKIKEVQKRLGYTLDPAFLNYFRSVNGVRLIAYYKPGFPPQEAVARFEKSTKGQASYMYNHVLWIPSLEEIVAHSALQSPNKNGKRASYFPFDSVHADFDDKEMVMIDLHSGNKDPYLDFSNDGMRTVLGKRYALARSYLELMLLTYARTVIRRMVFNKEWNAKLKTYKKSPLQIAAQRGHWYRDLFPFPEAIEYSASRGSVLSGPEFGGQVDSDF